MTKKCLQTKLARFVCILPLFILPLLYSCLYTKPEVLHDSQNHILYLWNANAPEAVEMLLEKAEITAKKIDLSLEHDIALELLGVPKSLLERQICIKTETATPGVPIQVVRKYNLNFLGGDSVTVNPNDSNCDKINIGSGSALLFPEPELLDELDKSKLLAGKPEGLKAKSVATHHAPSMISVRITKEVVNNKWAFVVISILAFDALGGLVTFLWSYIKFIWSGKW